MDLTDKQWVALEPLLPKPPEACGRTRQAVAGHTRGAERCVVGT